MNTQTITWINPPDLPKSKKDVLIKYLHKNGTEVNQMGTFGKDGSVWIIGGRFGFDVVKKVIAWAEI